MLSILGSLALYSLFEWLCRCSLQVFFLVDFCPGIFRSYFLSSEFSFVDVDFEFSYSLVAPVPLSVEPSLVQ